MIKRKELKLEEEIFELTECVQKNFLVKPLH